MLDSGSVKEIMSLISKGIGLAKKAKHALKDEIKAMTPVYISPVRRINGVKLNERICAMTFDDGPTNYPTNPDKHGGKPLTLCILEALEAHGAKGTFDSIGDTSENYPDQAGEIGTAMWGGIAYDHYPDINLDQYAGVKNCPELTKRILSGGHEITSHSYVHRIWGAKPLVYGKRAYMGNFEDVVGDLKRFDDLMKNDYGYEVKLSRPPHYVDKITNSFTSYDAYAVMGWQYLGAGPDGGGWLPLADYDAEVDAMVKAIENPLRANPDAFCGSIIFQKDGCNMMKRTPVADALSKQLDILCEYGYKVVSVSELMSMSQFEDLGPGDEGFEAAMEMLKKGMCSAFDDNCIHLEKTVTKEELAAMLYGWEAARLRAKEKASFGSVYKYAMKIASEKGTDLDAMLYGKNRLQLIEYLATI